MLNNGVVRELGGSNYTRQPRKAYMSSELIYYVYAYLRSKDSKTAKAGTPYYIGKGKGHRAWLSHRKVPVPSKDNIVLLEQCLTTVGALAIERRMIKWYGRKDAGTGILINKTDGGDGSDGFKISSSTKSKMSVVRKGKPKSPEHRAKIAAAVKAKYLSEEYRNMMTEAIKSRDERYHLTKPT
jgi:hypothetical protein